MENQNFERNVNSNRNGTDKINSISENPTKIKISFDFTRSLTSHTGNLGCVCSHIFQKRSLGALIGAGALKRANTVYFIVGMIIPGEEIRCVFNI